MTQTPTHAAGGLRELISFRIGAQEFCVDIMVIREIRGWTAATALPQSPAFVRGVINLRGAVLPIVDLASRLGFESTEVNDRNVIIVADIGGQVVGLLVDAIQGQRQVVIKSLEANYRQVPGVAAATILGDGRVALILDIDTIVAVSRGETRKAG